MDQPPEYMEVYIDFLPNQPKDEQGKKMLRQMLSTRFEQKLTSAVERIFDLPPLMLKPECDYLRLLVEARELYVEGRFYSCVATCGIVGERLVKDIFRASVLIQQSGISHTPSEGALDQLERVEISGIIHFLREAKLLADDAAKAADKLSQLRNKYAHARGKEPDLDALRAIKLLHQVVEETVSLFKNIHP